MSNTTADILLDEDALRYEPFAAAVAKSDGGDVENDTYVAGSDEAQRV